VSNDVPHETTDHALIAEIIEAAHRGWIIGFHGLMDVAWHVVGFTEGRTNHRNPHNHPLCEVCTRPVNPARGVLIAGIDGYDLTIGSECARRLKRAGFRW
jgi:hypothetical protein